MLKFSEKPLSQIIAASHAVMPTRFTVIYTEGLGYGDPYSNAMWHALEAPMAAT